MRAHRRANKTWLFCVLLLLLLLIVAIARRVFFRLHFIWFIKYADSSLLNVHFNVNIVIFVVVVWFYFKYASKRSIRDVFSGTLHHLSLVQSICVHFVCKKENEKAQLTIGHILENHFTMHYIHIKMGYAISVRRIWSVRDSWMLFRLESLECRDDCSLLIFHSLAVSVPAKPLLNSCVHYRTFTQNRSHMHIHAACIFSFALTRTLFLSTGFALP